VHGFDVFAVVKSYVFVQTELDNARTAEMTAQEVQKKLQLHSESADQLDVAMKVSVLLYLFALVSNKNLILCCSFKRPRNSRSCRVASCNAKSAKKRELID
jgi:hypothetical protein